MIFLLSLNQNGDPDPVDLPDRNACGITTTFFGPAKDKDGKDVIGTIPCPLTLEQYKELLEMEFAPLKAFAAAGGRIAIPCDANGKPSLGAGLSSIAEGKFNPDNFAGHRAALQEQFAELEKASRAANKNPSLQELAAARAQLTQDLTALREPLSKQATAQQANVQQQTIVQQAPLQKLQEVIIDPIKITLPKETQAFLDQLNEAKAAVDKHLTKAAQLVTEAKSVHLQKAAVVNKAASQAIPSAVIQELSGESKPPITQESAEKEPSAIQTSVSIINNLPLINRLVDGNNFSAQEISDKQTDEAKNLSNLLATSLFETLRDNNSIAATAESFKPVKMANNTIVGKGETNKQPYFGYEENGEKFQISIKGNDLVFLAANPDKNAPKDQQWLPVEKTPKEMIAEITKIAEKTGVTELGGVSIDKLKEFGSELKDQVVGIDKLISKSNRGQVADVENIALPDAVKAELDAKKGITLAGGDELEQESSSDKNLSQEELAAIGAQEAADQFADLDKKKNTPQAPQKSDIQPKQPSWVERLNAGDKVATSYQSILDGVSNNKSGGDKGRG